MARQTLKITKFEGGRNSKYDPRDIQDNELAEALNVDVSNPGYIQLGGNFLSDSSIGDATINTEFDNSNTNLFAFAHDYEIAKTQNYTDGSATIAVGDTVTGALSGASGVVIRNTISSGSTGGNDAAGTLYLINSQAGFINDENIQVSASTKAVADGTGSPPAESTSPIIVLSDDEAIDFQDEHTNLWYTDVLDIGGSSSATPEMSYYYYDGALRVSDKVHSNENTPKWFGHIKKDMMSNILASDGSAGSNKPAINSWVKDEVVPSPPNDTTLKGLQVFDSYSEAYPATNEKVILKFRQRTADDLPITAITVDSNTNIATATCSDHSALGLGEGTNIVITGTDHNNGEYEIIGTPTTTTFTFQPTVVTAETTILSGTELIQEGDFSGTDDGDPWTIGTGWTYDTGNNNCDHNGSNDGTALTNTLSASLSRGAHYRLSFTTAVQAFVLTIKDQADNVLVASATYAAGATYTLTLSPTVVSVSAIKFVATASGTGANAEIVGSTPVTCQKNTGVLRKDTDSLNSDLKDKWSFGMSFIYDKDQESLIHTGFKNVSDSFYEMGSASSANYIVDWTSFINEPECFIGFQYSNTTRMWNQRIKGFKIYMKRVGNNGAEGDWLLFSVVDFERGEYRIVAGADTWRPLHQNASNSYQVNNSTGLDEVTNLPIDTFESENFFPPDVDTITASWKTATVVNRTTYAGNVVVNGRTYPDRIIKSGLLSPDVFPNNIAYQVDVLESDGDSITHLEGVGDRLFVFKRKSLTVINTAGQSGEFIESSMPYLGVFDSRKVCKAEGGIAWINPSGLFYFDGNSTTNLIEGKFSATTWSGYSGLDTAHSSIGYSEKDRKLIINIYRIAAANYGFVYDFKTKSFFYMSNTLTSTTGTAYTSNLVSVPLIKELILGEVDNDTSGDRRVDFKKWSTAPQASTTASGIGTGMQIRTKDLDFGEPAVRKKIYKVYITYKTGSGSSSVGVAYATNGDKSTNALSSITLKHFKAKSDCTVDTGVLYLDASKSEWTTAIMRPNVSSEANNIYSFQLFLFNKASTAVHEDFQINDITIIYRIKPVR